MTYKHTDFQDSVIGRSLTKLALDKGLITAEKPEQFKKVADVIKDVESLQPTDNLDANLLKLCSGLRAKGFDKYASEIEVKFLRLKQANALYDVSKETGEDVINQAHPEGSHKLEHVEGDATIETILDKQKAIQKAILKQPTGKLAAKDALNIARIILAQTRIDTTAIKTAVDKIVSGDIMNALDQALAIASHKLGVDPNVSDIFKHPLTTLWQHKSAIIPLVGPALQLFQRQNTTLKDAKTQLQSDLNDFDAEVNIDNINDIIGRVDSIISIINAMDIDASALDVKKTIIGDLGSGKAKLEEAKKTFSPSIKSIPTSTPYDTAKARITELLNGLLEWKTTVSQFDDAEDKQTGLVWIAATENSLTHLLDHVSQTDAAALNSQVLPGLQKIEKDMQDFYNAWIK